MGIQTPNGFNLDTGGQRVVVDPVTRIEGHMRCEVNIDENNFIRNAVVLAFITNETISIMENSALMGVPWPEPMVSALAKSRPWPAWTSSPRLFASFAPLRMRSNSRAEASR